MSICPGCGYKLTHLSGAPRGLHGAFEAEVRCPECAQVVAPGTRVLVGSVTPHQVGARMQLGWIAGFGVLALFFALSAAKQVRALSATIGSGDLNGLLPLLDPSLLGCGFMIFWIARGTLTRRKYRQPEDITRAIAAKSLKEARYHQQHANPG